MMVAIDGRGPRRRHDRTCCACCAQAGADPNVVRRIQYITAITAAPRCTDATRAGKKKIMAELVALGADPDIKDEDGLTALDYAMSRGWIAYLTVRPAPRAGSGEGTCAIWARRWRLGKMPDWPGEFPPIGPPRQHESEIWPL